MSRLPIRPAQFPLEARRGEIERARAIQGKLHEVYGFVETEGAGEAVLEVSFPVQFFEKPTISTGGELEENQVLEDGNFPIIDANMYRWKTRDHNGKTYYMGGFLALKVQGPEGMRAIVHWQVRGRALRNPLTELGNIETVI